MTLNADLYSIFSYVSYTNDTSEEGTIIKAALASYNTSWHVLSVNGQYVTSNINGMEAVAYGLDSNNDGAYEQVVIAYRGSDSIEDWTIDDLAMALGAVPAQLGSAESFYQSVLDAYCKNPDGITYNTSKLSITGHSLGGALAQLVGSEYGNYTVTFNAPGMLVQAFNFGFTHTINITNYVVMNDYVGNYGTHVGITRYIQPVPITTDPWQDTHSSILNYTEENFGLIYTSYDLDGALTQAESLSLWYYDKNNTVTNQVGNGVLNLVSTTALQTAIEKINTVIGTPLHTLQYQISEGQIIIGDATGSETNPLTGSNPLLGVGGNDTIWGNDGKDSIEGLGGNDIIKFNNYKLSKCA